MKTAKTFRLSEQAVKQLQTLKEKTGTNETAIIEIALALFERGILEARSDQRTVGRGPSVAAGEAPTVQDPNMALEQAEDEQMQEALKGEIIHPHRKRRRKRK